MSTTCNKDLPPPIRKPKRRLSLKTAIATMSGKASQIAKPLMDPIGEFPSVIDGKLHKIEENLLELQADIIIREGLLSDKEKQLQYHERELNERDALLEAHQKLIRSSAEKTKNNNNNNNNKPANSVSDAERKALDALKHQLEVQEASLKDARQMLQEREDYIVECENELVEQSMLITEREALVEQREENHEAKKFFDQRKASEAS